MTMSLVIPDWIVWTFSVLNVVATVIGWWALLGMAYVAFVAQNRFSIWM